MLAQVRTGRKVGHCAEGNAHRILAHIAACVTSAAVLILNVVSKWNSSGGAVCPWFGEGVPEGLCSSFVELTSGL